MPPNADPSPIDIWLIRHAPSLHGGAMAGRRDVAADCSDTAAFEALRRRIALQPGDLLHASPALRCQQTLAALWPGAQAPIPRLDPQLWEQDFGAWEGRAFSDIPDLGTLALADLAAFAPPSGESFCALCNRIWPVLQTMAPGRHVIIAHAGVVRAALGLALGAAPLSLAFTIAPLSLTRITHFPGSGTWAVGWVNWTGP